MSSVLHNNNIYSFYNVSIFDQLPNPITDNINVYHDNIPANYTAFVFCYYVRKDEVEKLKDDFNRWFRMVSTHQYIGGAAIELRINEWDEKHFMNNVPASIVRFVIYLDLENAAEAIIARNQLDSEVARIRNSYLNEHNRFNERAHQVGRDILEGVCFVN